MEDLGWVRAIVWSTVLVGCGPGVGAGSGETSGSTTSSSSSEAAPSSSSSDTSTADGSSTSGEPVPPPLQGPGCGPPPPCRRGTLDGNVRIESAADLALLEGYTHVDGLVEILGAEDLVCLDTLACLEVVGGDLRIQDNRSLQSTRGLGNVREVGTNGSRFRSIVVANNDVLEDLSGFAVEYVADVVIIRNPSLRTVSGFSSLAEVAEVSLRDNPLLTSIEGFAGLSRIYDSCHITHNPGLCWPDFVTAQCPDVGQRYGSWVAHNHARCPPVPIDPPRAPSSKVTDCSIISQSCPPGQKCQPYDDQPDNSYKDNWACQELIPSPGAPGTPCDFRDEIDICDRDSMCMGFQCTPFQVAFDTCLDSRATPLWNGANNFVCLPSCDPLAQDCQDGLACIPFYDSFHCARNDSEPGAGGVGSTCEAVNQCNAGFARAFPDLSELCDADAVGCCLPFCDTLRPDCPQGLVCTSWWDDDRDPPYPWERVGLCRDPRP